MEEGRREYKGYRLVGQALLIFDVIWMVGWFAMNCWFIADEAVDNLFRDAARNLLFHHASTGGILHVLRFGAARWDSGIPFFFALLADVEAATAVIINVPSTHTGARILLLNWAWLAVGLSSCAILWFLSAPPERRPGHYASIK